jgi:spermidine/putrescine transport system substrate-binding protein
VTAQPWSRRRFLRTAATGALAVPGLSAILAACNTTTAQQPTPDAGLPLHEDLAIDPRAPVERGGVLRIYEWRDYLDHGVLRSFVDRYADAGVDVRIDSFTTSAEEAAALQGGAPYDVVFPSIASLPGLVQQRLLRPLAHEALPHLVSLWPFFRADDGPFYDPGQRYTIPYTVYSTGIGWRTDLVDPDGAPDRLATPYDTYWDPGHRGEIGIVDDDREAIAMALLRRGEDPNTTDPGIVAAAVDDLVAMANAVDVEISGDGAYEELQTGEYAVQQAWSGDVLAAKRFGPSTPGSLARTDFVWPEGGVVGCDLMAVCANGNNPVLAHAFLDHLLREDVALRNFAWNGYQPPVASATRSAFADPSFEWNSLVPEHLLGALLDPEDLDVGRFLRPLAPDQEAAWRDGWERFRDAVG